MDPLAEAEPEAEPLENVHGYIYCPMNRQLGFVYVHWANRRSVILHIGNALKDVSCTYIDTQFNESTFPEINTFMRKFVKAQFYATYPAQLELNWMFVRTEKRFEPQTMPSLCRLSKFTVGVRF